MPTHPKKGVDTTGDPDDISSEVADERHLENIPMQLPTTEPSTDSPIVASAEEDVRGEKKKIIKNVILISVSFLCVFTAISGLAQLQSSLHRTNGMGVITISVMNASKLLSSMFLPKIVITLVGHKWTITAGFLGCIVWIAANGYAVWGTMVTASVVVGLCAAPLWTAQCAYFTLVGQRYAALTGQKGSAIVSRFFGLFFMFAQICKCLRASVTLFSFLISRNSILI